MGNCPKCGSTKIKLIGSSYPKTYECEECGYIFISPPKTFIDDS